MRHPSFPFYLPLLAVLLHSLLATHAFCENPHERWENTIKSFEQQDQRTFPEKQGVLFVGSSSIRMWDLGKSFPEKHYLNRGFGGSEIADCVYFADRIVLPYQPRTIVMYAGDNDIAGGKLPEQVLEDFQQFVKLVHGKLSDTRIIFIAIKPSIARWKLVDKVRAANKLIQDFASREELLEFVDVDTPMIGDDSKPRADLFRDDGLHLNDKGYELWTALVGKAIDPPTTE